MADEKDTKQTVSKTWKDAEWKDIKPGDIVQIKYYNFGTTRVEHIGSKFLYGIFTDTGDLWMHYDVGDGHLIENDFEIEKYEEEK